ncbi:hypothetical protein M408DRAFT_76581 [Serendipita vermifera MAFF 305830]|uniref:G-patch domain-containing protein n=1 Tax=Serendipita vermifera MAFF 305830 TaxID=933852 RepID=A0A0C3AV97_SERVB|nr:hypothetical protein M408DRAFT_325116 [Serendipita vermifera MAFF 305830]KIM23944.1 hypothetical protein M408DRAFT_76581 [Serendipita vermifera MAFF 305830]
MDEDSYQYQHKHGSKGKRMVASEASQHVIFLGLDPDFVESDMLLFLRSLDLNVESVIIIRDRTTGISISFGFAQFPTIQEAQKFVEPNFPFVTIPPPQSHGASATQAFHDGTGAHLGRRVKIDYSQSAQGGGPRAGGRSQNDGTRDIGNSQTPVVLLRGLDPMSTLDVIAEALKASSGAVGQGASGMKRIVLIRDRYTAMGIGLAFVEFVDSDSAGRLLGATMSPELHPEGFRISDRPVAASFASTVSFQPLAPHSLRDEACIMGSTSMGGTEGVFAKYWDENAVVVEMAFEVSEPVAKKDTMAQGEKRKKKKNKDDDATKLSTALPTNLKPLTFNMNKSASQVKPAVPQLSSAAAVSSAFMAVDPDEPEPIPDNKPLDKAMTFRKVAPLIASKKVATSINKWNEVSHELRGGPSTSNKPEQIPQVQIAMISAPAPAVAVAAVPASEPDTEANMEHCILETFTCYLCSRQLKSQDQLKRHKNLANETLRQTAKEKVAAKLQGATPAGSSSTAKPVYRDRALERRVIHGQPDFPVPEPSSSTSGASGGGGGGPGNKRIRDVPLAVSAPPPQPPKEPAKDENNIGNKLLKKMGWSEGTGLGLSGEGRVDPIQTAMYASGAGLGASKGKDITKVAGMDYAALSKESVSTRLDFQHLQGDFFSEDIVRRLFTDYLDRCYRPGNDTGNDV